MNVVFSVECYNEYFPVSYARVQMVSAVNKPVYMVLCSILPVNIEAEQPGFTSFVAVLVPLAEYNYSGVLLCCCHACCGKQLARYLSCYILFPCSSNTNLVSNTSLFSLVEKLKSYNKSLSQIEARFDNLR